MSETVADPVIAPAPEAPPAPEPVAAPPVEAVAAAPEPAVAAEPAAKPAEESLLTGAEAEPVPEPAPPEPIQYADFTWPEGITPNAEEIKPYTDILAKHQVPQEAAQELVSMFTKQAQDMAEARKKVWGDTQAEWRKAFQEDPDIGGNRQDTTLRRAAGVLDRFGGTADQVAELRNVLTLTGAGNHPSVIRLMHNLSKVLREGAPVPAVGAKAPAGRNTASTRYANSMNGAA